MATQIVLMIVIFGLGILVGNRLFPLFFQTPQPPVLISAPQAQKPLKSYEQGLDEGRNAMMEKVNKTLMEKGLIRYPLDTELSVAMPVSSLFGFVKEIKSDSIVLDYNTSQFDPLNPQSLTKEIHFDSATQLIKYSSPSQGAVPVGNTPSASNLGSSTPNPAEGTADVSIPMTIKVGDLKIGDYIRVNSQEDVKGAQSVLASQIMVYPLNDNPYLKGDFKGSYNSLPTASGVPIGKLQPASEVPSGLSSAEAVPTAQPTENFVSPGASPAQP